MRHPPPSSFPSFDLRIGFCPSYILVLNFMVYYLLLFSTIMFCFFISCVTPLMPVPGTKAGFELLILLPYLPSARITSMYHLTQFPSCLLHLKARLRWNILLWFPS